MRFLYKELNLFLVTFSSILSKIHNNIATWLKSTLLLIVDLLTVQKQADVSDYGYLMLVAMTTSCAVLFAVIVTAACVTLARRHRLRHHHHHQGDPVSFQGRHVTCPHTRSIGQFNALYYTVKTTLCLKKRPTLSFAVTLTNSLLTDFYRATLCVARSLGS